MKLSLDRKVVHRRRLRRRGVRLAGRVGGHGRPVHGRRARPRSPPRWTAPRPPKLMTAAGLPRTASTSTLKAPGDPLHANFGLAVVAGLKGSPFRVTAKQIPAETYWDTVWMKDPFCVDDWNRRHPVETRGAATATATRRGTSRSGRAPRWTRCSTRRYASQGDALTQATTEVVPVHGQRRRGQRRQRRAHPRLPQPPVDGPEDAPRSCPGPSPCSTSQARCGILRVTEVPEPFFSETGLAPQEDVERRRPPRNGEAAAAAWLVRAVAVPARARHAAGSSPSSCSPRRTSWASTWP